jgi:hypothetical protein
MRSITISEFKEHWEPLSESTYDLDKNNPLGYRLRDRSWRRILLPRWPGEPFGPPSWRDFNRLSGTERFSINHYEPFCQGIRNLGINGVIAYSSFSLKQSTEDIAQWAPGPVRGEGTCASECLPTTDELLEACRTDLSPPECYDCLISKDGSWTLTKKDYGISFLEGSPDALEELLSPWGGEKAVYAMFCDYDLGGEFYYNIANGYIDPEFEKQRQLIYQCAGWKAPSYTYQEMEKICPWGLHEWGDPEWNEAHGYPGPQYDSTTWNWEKAVQQWEQYRAKKENPHR